MIGALLPAQPAYAFGNHWRPAGLGVDGADPRVARHAGAPGFRPAARRVMATDYRGVGYRPTAPTRTFPAISTRPSAAYQRSYPRPYPAFVPQPGGWGGPFGVMGRMWGQPMPMLGPQIASHGHYGPARSAYPAPVRPAYARPSPAGAPHAAGLGSSYKAQPGRFAQSSPRWRNWRPTASRFGVAPRSSVSRPAYRSRAIPTLGRHLAAAPAWRPLPARVATPRGLTAARGHSWTFRPTDNGRVARRMAGARPASSHLPGWASTYDELGKDCSWCSGS